MCQNCSYPVMRMPFYEINFLRENYRVEKSSISTNYSTDTRFNNGAKYPRMADNETSVISSKYLESLCKANGIDISSLQCDTVENNVQSLEMFFGGLPTLVGIKHFANLKCLRLIGQDITCIKSLIDIANSLEELWICEGHLKVRQMFIMCMCLLIRRILPVLNRAKNCVNYTFTRMKLKMRLHLLHYHFSRHCG